MKKNIGLKTLLSIYTFLAAIGGLGEALFPHQFVGSFMTLNSGGILMTQNTGVFQLGTAIISLMALRIRDYAALRAIVTALTVINFGVVAVALQQMFASGKFSTDNLGDLVLHGLMALWFLYYAISYWATNVRKK